MKEIKTLQIIDLFSENNLLFNIIENESNTDKIIINEIRKSSKFKPSLNL